MTTTKQDSLPKRIREILAHNPSTTHELADALGIHVRLVASHAAVMRQRRLLEPSGDSRRNRQGRRCIVWRLTSIPTLSACHP